MGIFGNKILVAPEDVFVELNDDKITLNGVVIDIPTHIDALSKILGKPRKAVFKKDKDMNSALDSKRVNYTWDKLGLCCYTRNGGVVYCFEMRLNKGEICPKHYPKEFFRGKVKINGTPWLEAVKNAPPTPLAPDEPEFFREITLGGYSAVAEYVDFTQDESTRTEKDFTTLSVQLAEG